MLLAIDQGTTSCRAILFADGGSAVRAVAQREFTQHFPQPGWVEHDPAEIWATQLGVVTECLTRAGAKAADLHAIGITNQRETAVLWERATGRPVCNAIVWQDRRTADRCDHLRREGHADLIRERTGLEIDAYFSATKLAWMLESVPRARERALKGELAFGTVDAWLIWKLTGGRVHATDASNASRTMLCNIRTLEWDNDLLDLFDIPREILPKIGPSAGPIATTAPGLLDAQVPIAGVAGDQQAALFGQRCFAPGTAKNTYGTGCFMLMQTGAEPVGSNNRLLSTVGWRLSGSAEASPEKRAGRAYALEGAVFIAGAVVQWLRDGLGLIRHTADIEPLAATVPDNGGVAFVPAFTGLGAPHWDQHARGTITGLTRGATAAHIARAALEAIALQVADVADAMAADAGRAMTELRVDGGAASNDLLMQIQADVLGVPVVRPGNLESTALGAALLAGLGVGLFRSLDEIARADEPERIFEPAMDPTRSRALRDQWNDAITRARS
ncbi:MAG: glycerol kinase GlpK [Phycisphaeraceae bacterium]|nr:MAG: glycerol kinase GlpK [Phycisphaeraceae bacterium]